MKHITTVLLFGLLSTAVFATDEILFVKNMTWAQVKARALREKKMIFLDAYASWCGPCQYMEVTVYTQKEAADFFNANFINVKIDMEKGEGPSLSTEFDVSAYPTFLFFSAEGLPVHKYVGALATTEFVELGKNALLPSRQYFTLKEKARKLLLSDEDFSYWASLATDFEDPDKAEIIQRYFTVKTDILANKDILTTLLYYFTPTDAQLSLLYNRQARIKELMGWEESKLKSVLYEHMFSKAMEVYEASGHLIDSFLSIVRKFDPTSVHFARQDLAIREALFIEKDASKTVTLIIGYLKDTRQPLELETLAGWVIGYYQYFTKSSMAQLSKELLTFSLRPMDKDKEYWFYLTQTLACIRTGEDARANEAAAKALKYPQLPQEYREILEQLLEEEL